jgi:SPP1 family predicted phage head-tail adaptor
MRAGRLRHRVTVESATETQGASGEVTLGWTTWASAWAAVEPLAGAERFAAQQVNAEVTHRVTLRHLPGLSPRMRIRHEGRVLEIDAVLNVEERDRETHALCVERPA